MKIVSMEKFRKKLKKEGRSLKWFHENYLKNICKYGYFIKQINFQDCMQNNVKNVVEQYLKTKQ